VTAGNYETRAPFFAHNQRSSRKAGPRAQGAPPRRDVDEETIFPLLRRYPAAGIYNGAGFDRWRQSGTRNPKLMYMTRELP